jgi:hypothetical protein
MMDSKRLESTDYGQKKLHPDLVIVHPDLVIVHPDFVYR